MTIRIRNFGPVTDGQVDLKPLTILIGPNNTGKSYAAMLIHSILSSGERYGAPRRLHQRRIGRHEKLYYEHVDELERIVWKNSKLASFDIPQPYTEKLFHSTCGLISSTIKAALERNFGSGIRDLVKRGAMSAHLDIVGSQNFTIDLDSDLQLKSRSSFDVKYRVERTKKDKHVDSPPLVRNDEDSPPLVRNDEDMTTVIVDRRLPTDYFIDDAIVCVTQSIFNRTSLISDTSHYFPASRSGILQGHKALSAGIIQSAQFAGAEPINVPKLTGVVSDFISNIILFPRHRQNFSNMAERMEEDLLGGHIVMKRHDRYTMPDIVYVAGAETFPLHAASSTVSEIAPLSLYLKHIVHQGDLLIIEEPEAHLHPKNQVVLARYIVRMIRAGLRVVLTTHSEFLLEGLSMFVIASGVKPEIRGKILEADPDDRLYPDEISTHEFRRDDDGSVHIHPIEYDKEQGILQGEFTKVSKILYDKSIRLEESVDKP